MIQKMFSALCFLLPSFATRIIFRLLGHKIGKNAKMSIFSFICAAHIELGNDVEIRPLVFIKVRRLIVGSNSIISFGTQIKGDRDFVAKGNNFVGVHCMIHCDEDMKMGFYSGLGPGCVAYTHGSFLPVTEGYPAKFEEIVLEDYVWIGMAVLLLPGAHVESNCVINPGVVLKSTIKSNTLLESSSTSFRALSLKKMQAFLRKKPEDYHEEIIRGFADHHKKACEYDEQSREFTVGKDSTYKCFPEENRIVLAHKNEKVTYDLKEFYTDNSKLKIHREFLFFIRRRFGIILRTKYDP